MLRMPQQLASSACRMSPRLLLKQQRKRNRKPAKSRKMMSPIRPRPALSPQQLDKLPLNRTLRGRPQEQQSQSQQQRQVQASKKVPVQQARLRAMRAETKGGRRARTKRKR